MVRRNLAQEMHEAVDTQAQQLNSTIVQVNRFWVTIFSNNEGVHVYYQIHNRRYNAREMSIEQAVSEHRNFNMDSRNRFFSEAREDMRAHTLSLSMPSIPNFL